MKKIVPIILLSLLTLCGCNDYRKLEVLDVDLTSVRLKSTSSAEIVLTVTVDNHSKHTILLESADGTVLKETRNFANFALSDAPKIRSGQRNKVKLHIDVKVDDPLALIASGLDFRTWRKDEFTVNARIVMRKEGAGKQVFRIKRVPFERILNLLDK